MSRRDSATSGRVRGRRPTTPGCPPTFWFSTSTARSALPSPSKSPVTRVAEALAAGSGKNAATAGASRAPCFTPPTLPAPACAQEELGASHRHLADHERRGVDGTAEGDPAGLQGGGGDRLEHRLKVGGDRELVRGCGEL